LWAGDNVTVSRQMAESYHNTIQAAGVMQEVQGH